MSIDREKIRARRIARQLTLEEAGRAAGFVASGAAVRWHDLESGKIPDPRISTVVNVARALGCSVEDLLVDGARPDGGGSGRQKKNRKRGDQRDKSASGSAGSTGRPLASSMKVKATSVDSPAKSTVRKHSGH